MGGVGVETISIRRIRWFRVSDINTDPVARFKAIPTGPLNLASVPLPSSQPAVTKPSASLFPPGE